MYDKIQKFCEDKGISVAQFERICGFGNGYVAKLKNHAPGTVKARRIAQVLGVSLTSLLDEEENSE